MLIPHIVFLWMLPILAIITVPLTEAASNFDTWLREFRNEARGQGISDMVLDSAFSKITPISRVIELDRNQPEKTMTFSQYLRNVVPPSRINQARRQYREHRKLLEEIGTRYKIQPRFLVAFWAIESDFGRNQGNFSVIASLATLAYDGRRSAYFRGELLDALRILQRGDVTTSRMRGSWAGAMGQAQFMPSVFLKYAVDYDGNGRCDIWSSSADVFASAANYLNNIGWDGTKSWGVEVHLPSNFDVQLLGLDHSKTLNEWHELGIRTVNGQPITGEIPASIVQPGNVDNRVFAVYQNYHVIRNWNRSNYFATAVGLLADTMMTSPSPPIEPAKKKMNLLDLPRRPSPISSPRER